MYFFVCGGTPGSRRASTSTVPRSSSRVASRPSSTNDVRPWQRPRPKTFSIRSSNRTETLSCPTSKMGPTKHGLGDDPAHGRWHLAASVPLVDEVDGRRVIPAPLHFDGSDARQEFEHPRDGVSIGLEHGFARPARAGGRWC